LSNEARVFKPCTELNYLYTFAYYLKSMGDDNQQYSTNTKEYVSNPQQTNSDMLRYLLDYSKELQEIEQNLRGMRWNVRSSRMERVNMPLMNDYGVNNILGIIRAYINKNIKLSNFDEAQIQMIIGILHRRVADDLVKHQLEYGIIDYNKIALIDSGQKDNKDNMITLWYINDNSVLDVSKLDILMEEITTPIFACLKRAEGRGERDIFAQGTVRYIENTAQQQQGRSRLQFWKK
jgi:hypothetical protein